jgi:hypothetical protein
MGDLSLEFYPFFYKDMNWALTLVRGKHILRVFENRAPRRMFATKEEVTGEEENYIIRSLIILLFTKQAYNQDDQITDNELGWVEHN